MRFGYAFMGVGLAIVKWPLLIQDADDMNAAIQEGVVQLVLRCHHRRHPVGIRLEALRQDARECVALKSAPPSSRYDYPNGLLVPTT